MHVRRGDYLTILGQAVHGNLSLSHHHNALTEKLQNVLQARSAEFYDEPNDIPIYVKELHSETEIFNPTEPDLLLSIQKPWQI